MYNTIATTIIRNKRPRSNTDPNLLGKYPAKKEDTKIQRNNEKEHLFSNLQNA